MTGGLERGSGQGLGGMILRSSAWLVGARFGRIIITLAGTAVLSRLLTPADFGLFFFAITALALVVIVLEGFIDLPITREDDLTTNAIRSVVWASLFVVGAFSAALWQAAPTLERTIGFPALTETLRAMIPAFVAQVPLLVSSALLKRQHRFGAVAAGQVLTVAIYIGVACALVLMHHGFASLIIAINVAQISVAALLMAFARLPILPPRTVTFPDGLASGGSGAAARLVSWIWTNLDTVAVSMLFGPAVTGLYSRAYNLNVQAKEPFAAIDQPIRQAFAAMKHRSDGFAVQAMMALRLMTLLSSMAAAGMIVFRDTIVYVLLGSQWGAAAPLLAILAAGLPARVALLYIDSVTIASGAMRAILLRNLAVTGLIAVALLWLAPNGVEWVAAVVTGVVYISLALVDRGSGQPHALSARAVAFGMAPGIAVGTALAAAGLGIEHLNHPIGYEVAAKVVLFLGAFGLIGFKIPDHWLGAQLAPIRTRLLRWSLRLST